MLLYYFVFCVPPHRFLRRFVAEGGISTLNTIQHHASEMHLTNSMVHKVKVHRLQNGRFHDKRITCSPPRWSLISMPYSFYLQYTYTTYITRTLIF